MNEKREKELFEVLVRALGVLVLLHGARMFWLVFINWAWPYAFPRGMEPYVWDQDFVYALLVLALGTTMTRHPKLVVSFSYYKTPDSEPSD